MSDFVTCDVVHTIETYYGLYKNRNLYNVWFCPCDIVIVFGNNVGHSTFQIIWTALLQHNSYQLLLNIILNRNVQQHTFDVSYTTSQTVTSPSTLLHWTSWHLILLIPRICVLGAYDNTLTPTHFLCYHTNKNTSSSMTSWKITVAINMAIHTN